MATPGTPSGTSTFNLSDTMIVLEAFDRIQIRGPAITRHHLHTAKISLNLELQRWGNLGINLWKEVTGQVIPIVAGQATYPLPPNLITLTEMYYTTVNGDGAGYNNDRIMTPITRTQYAMIPNKLQPGQPTQYWFQRLQAPQVTIWQPPTQQAPAYVITWNGLLQIQDAGLGSGQTPDLVYRAFDALCAAMAHRLSVKFSPPPIQQMRKAEAVEAWNDFTTNDQELGAMIMAPNLAGYGNLRR